MWIPLIISSYWYYFFFWGEGGCASLTIFGSPQLQGNECYRVTIHLGLSSHRTPFPQVDQYPMINVDRKAQVVLEAT